MRVILPLLPHRLDEYPLGALTVPLAIEHALPGAEVEFAFGDGHDDFMTDSQGSEVRRRVVLASAGVVTIILG